MLLGILEQGWKKPRLLTKKNRFLGFYQKLGFKGHKIINKK